VTDTISVTVPDQPTISVTVAEPVVEVSVNPPPTIEVTTSGPPGPGGRAIRTGVTPPTDADGQDGEYYLDQDSNVLYGPKNLGSIGLMTALAPASSMDMEMGFLIGSLINFTSDGQITALRYYRPAEAIRTTTQLFLYEVDGLVLTEVFSGGTSSESAEGWYEVALSPPMAVTSGQKMAVVFVLDEVDKIAAEGFESKASAMPDAVEGMVWVGTVMADPFGQPIMMEEVYTTGFMLIDVMFATVWPVAIASQKILHSTSPPQTTAWERDNLCVDTNTAIIYGPKLVAPQIGTFFPLGDTADDHQLVDTGVYGNEFLVTGPCRVTHLRFLRSALTDPSVTELTMYVSYGTEMEGHTSEMVMIDLTTPSPDGWFEVAVPFPLELSGIARMVEPAFEIDQWVQEQLFIGVDIPPDGYVAGVGLEDPYFPQSPEVRGSLQWQRSLLNDATMAGRARVDVRYEVLWPIFAHGGGPNLPLSGGTINGNLKVQSGNPDGGEDAAALWLEKTPDDATITMGVMDDEGSAQSMLQMTVENLSGSTPMSEVQLRSSGPVSLFGGDMMTSLNLNAESASLSGNGAWFALENNVAHIAAVESADFQFGSPVEFRYLGSSDWQNVRAATPVDPDDLTTKAYVDAHTHPSTTDFQFNYDSSATMGDPGSGKVRTDTVAGVPSTQIAFSDITNLGIDASQTFASLTTDDLIHFQKLDDANVWGRYRITASPTDNNGWWLIPVEGLEQHGTINKNQTILARFTYGGGGGGTIGGLLTTKGDLVVRNATTSVRLPVGPLAGQVLAVDPTAATGVVWRTLPGYNLLTPDQASMESSLTGLVAGGTLTRITSGGYHGSSFARLTITGNYNYLDANTPKAPVLPNEPYTLSWMVKSADGNSTQWAGYCYFYDAAGVSITETTVGTWRGDRPTNWTRVTGTVITPPNAAYIVPRLYFVVGGTVGTTWDVDAIGVWRGPGGDWAPPGTPIVGLGTLVTHPNVDDTLGQIWDSSKARWQSVHYDSGIREITAMLENGWKIDASRHVYIRRDLTSVRVFGDPNALNATSTTLISGAVWPPGFGSTAGCNSVAATRDTSSGAISGMLLGYGLAYYGAVGAGRGAILFRVETEATPTLPTSLPGTLYSAAPATLGWET
jgi:Domain of unknown function (DUF4082)